MKRITNLTKALYVIFILLIIFLIYLSVTLFTPTKDHVTINGEKIYVEIADDLDERSTGYQFRDNIPDDHGMLFIMPRPDRYLFWMKDTPLALDIIFIDDNYTIITKPMNHASAKCCAYRVESDGKSVVYTGDTDYCDEAIELAQNADILIIECSFPDALKSEGHLTPRLSGKIAKQANVKKLVLTHLYPVCDDSQIMEEAEKEFDNEIVIAEDYMKLYL